ncbi:hypothetical protein [Spiribacter roseus]|uniref:hypothetical protein n=1 Tax=Spiribacter roseus TaxID=1855875 RepID=UPI0012FD31C1
MDFLVLTLGIAASGFIYARFVWPKKFFAKTGAELENENWRIRNAAYSDLGVYPTIDTNSWSKSGYICRDIGVYVLYLPKSALRQAESSSILASAHPEAAAEASEYGVTWRLLSYDESVSIVDNLIVLADKLNYVKEWEGSRFLAKIGGKLPRKRYTSRFWPLLKGVTELEVRHGREVAFCYGINFDEDEDSGISYDVEKYIKHVDASDESAVAVCTDISNLSNNKDFLNSVEVEGITTDVSKVVNAACA